MDWAKILEDNVLAVVNYPMFAEPFLELKQEVGQKIKPGEIQQESQSKEIEAKAMNTRKESRAAKRKKRQSKKRRKNN